MRPTLLAATPLLSVLCWVAAMLVDPGDYAPGSVSLIGVGSLLLATIGTVGLVLVGGRWARWTLVSVLGASLVISLFRPLDVLGLVSLTATAVGLIVLLSPGAARGVRQRAAAAGPPAKAVLAMLYALAIPLALGLIPVEPNVWVLVFAAAGPVATYLYSRTIPGGLAALRFGLPILAVVTAFSMPVAHAVTALATAGLTTALAWSADVAIAFRPLVRRGSSYAIPPELVPREILDGARIDDRGKPV